MPSFLLIRQCCRRAWRLSAVRAVAAGWARLGDKSLFHQWWANANAQARGARPSKTISTSRLLTFRFKLIRR
jgi:hypothetical protein